MNEILKKYLRYFLNLLKQILILILFLPPAGAHSMVTFISQAVFKNDDKSSFVELYLKVPLYSVQLTLNEEGQYQASITVEMKYSLGDSTVYRNKFSMISPGFMDTLNTGYAMVDLKRCLLPYGNLRFDLLVTDDNNPANKAAFAALVNTVFKNNLVSLSDIELADTIYEASTVGKFSRNGFEIIPNVFNTFDKSQKSLFFYVEHYNSSDFVFDRTVFVRYSIFSDSSANPEVQEIIKQNAAKVNFLNGKLDISNLKTGNFKLLIELLDSKNRLLASKFIWFAKYDAASQVISSAEGENTRFFNLLSSYGFDQLKTNLDYISLIIRPDRLKEYEKVTKYGDSIIARDFLYNYWLQRDKNTPLQSWIAYLSAIEHANTLFSTTLRKGYLTDRGRIYVLYGPPNRVAESADPGIAYPYQIWHYYTLQDNQSNKKFVFFNKTGALNEYELLHSDALGQPQNPAWKDIIRKFNNLNPRSGEVYGDFLDKDFNE